MTVRPTGMPFARADSGFFTFVVTRVLPPLGIVLKIPDSGEIFIRKFEAPLTPSLPPLGAEAHTIPLNY